MEVSRFFNSTPDDTRRYSAEEFAEFMRTFYSTGIVSGGENLRVSPSSETLSVTIQPGSAMMEGYWYANTAALSLPVTAANTVHPRVDRVVLRLDLTAPVRSINLAVLKGTPSANPQPPALTRNSNVYELSLARLQIPANASVVSSLLDERYNGSVCGITQGLYSVDLTAFEQNQQEMLEEMRAQAQEAVQSVTDLSNAALLTKLKAIDGPGSGIDADLLDGQHGSYYLNYNNLTNKPAIPKIPYGTEPPTGGSPGDLYIQI